MPRMRPVRSHEGYATRALTARDPRFARIYAKLGHYPAEAEAAAPSARPARQAPPRGDLFPHPAAELADAAEALTYTELRERAEPLLGDDIPRSKAGLIEALRELAAGAR